MSLKIKINLSCFNDNIIQNKAPQLSIEQTKQTKNQDEDHSFEALIMKIYDYEEVSNYVMQRNINLKEREQFEV